MDTTAYLTTVYVLGAERNIGKAVTSIGIISTLLAPEQGYRIDDIGYIKPVGQQTYELLRAEGLATILLQEDSAEIVRRIEDIKIQPCDTAKRVLIARAYREHLTLWPALPDAPRLCLPPRRTR